MLKALPALILSLALISVLCPNAEAADKLQNALSNLEYEWATAKYKLPTKSAKLNELSKLEEKADTIARDNPRSADAKIWQAIILATHANVTKSLSGLPKVEKAKELLEESLKINPRAMEGSAHMTLGSLYYQVPGWPISYGDDDKAEEHLKAALAINPNGLDTNYWYGAFLLDDKRPAEAVTYLQKALAAPVRPKRQIADEGRKHEVLKAIADAEKILKKKSRGNE